MMHAVFVPRADIASQDLEVPINLGWQALGPALGLSTAALGLLCLRWLTRLCIVRRTGVEDWLLTIAMICSIGLTGGIAIRMIITFLSSSMELIREEFFQRKQVNFSKDDRGGYLVTMTPTVAKLVITNNVLYSSVTNLTKCSVVVQYLRLFSNPRLRVVCYSLLALLAGAGLYGAFAGIFICHPVQRLWDITTPGHCLDASKLWLACAGINIALDWIVWITPMPVISKLRLPRKQMIGVTVVFALGGFVCATSIARLIVVHNAVSEQKITKAGVSSLQWSAIEANVGIICASLMALKPLMLRFAPNLMVDRHPLRSAMRINTIDDDETLDVQFWAGGSVSTTCAGSETTAVTQPSHEHRIKVTTEMQQTAVNSIEDISTALPSPLLHRDNRLPTVK